MPVSVHILKSHGIVYVRYVGVARIDETRKALADYARHPDCRPGQNQLVDLARVTAVDDDFPALMALQAGKVDLFLANGDRPLIVYYAPSKAAQTMARMALRSWEGVHGIVARMLTDEAEALAVLGLRARSIAELVSADA